MALGLGASSLNSPEYDGIKYFCCIFIAFIVAWSLGYAIISISINVSNYTSVGILWRSFVIGLGLIVAVLACALMLVCAFKRLHRPNGYENIV
jgi:hypothetical protein